MTSLSRRHFVSSVMVGAAAAIGRPTLASGAEAAPKAAPSSEIKTGGVRMIPVVGGKHRVWTKKVGSGPIKLLTLHGGPGATHEIFECFEDFLPQNGIEFYYYDQLDSHYSDQPGDPTLWTVERYRDEVEEVRAGLGLTDFYLYGQSWGGMLAIEYALKYPKHLKGLVISSMTASIPSYVAYMSELRKQLPPDVIAVLDKYEAKGEYEAPEYQEVMLKIYGRHMCRLDPWPEALGRVFAKHGNMKVYGVMQGPNEFVVTGTFKDWDRWKDLPSIKVPTLVIGGRYDEMNPADLRREADLIPSSRLHICENGSHLAQWDDQEDYMAALVGFLKDVQAGRFPGK
jgi:proline iminopeptidase